MNAIFNGFPNNKVDKALVRYTLSCVISLISSVPLNSYIERKETGTDSEGDKKRE